jgi:hypothetical protein
MIKRLLVAAALVAVLAAGCGSKHNAATSATTQAPAATTAPTTAPPTTAAPTTAPPTTATPTTTKPALSLSQQDAIAAAQQYLNMGQGFSQAGLISQLDSPDGDQYSVADATFAVDSLNVNWNAQAVEAAKSYLQTSS